MAVQIDQDTSVAFTDPTQRGPELVAAIAAQRAQRITSQAFRMHAHQCPISRLALDQGQVLGLVDQAAEGARL